VIQKNLSRVKTALADLDRVESELPSVEKQFPKDVIYEVTTTKGMKAAIEHRAAWRDRRITVEKARTMAKAPILELGRTIDARAKRLTEQLRAGEEPIDQLIKAEEQRKEDERQARINAEAGRVLAIQEALAGIGQDVLIACGKTSADIQVLIDRMSSTQPDPLVFQEQIDQARAAWAAALVKLDTALKAKRWEEAEAKRIAEERAAEQAEAARLLAEERAQLARERAELEALRAAQVPAPVPPAPAPEPAPAPVEHHVEAAPILALQAEEAVSATSSSTEPATLKLGTICERLGFTVTAAFLADTLHIQPTSTDRAAKLYRESDFDKLCVALIAHVAGVRGDFT